MDIRTSEILKYSVVVLGPMFLCLILTSIWDDFFHESTIIIDPEYYSGLIGAISIAFSMLLFITSNQQSYKGLTSILLTTGPLTLIITGIGKVLQVAMEKGNPVATVYFLATTLLLIMFSMTIFLVIKHIKIIDEEGKKISEL